MTLGLPAVGQPGDVTKRDHPVVVIVGQRPRRYGTGGAPAGPFSTPRWRCRPASWTSPTPTGRIRLLGLGAPVILLLGGLRAFVRTYQAWRQDGAWWPWQGAGWLLLTAMLLVLTTSLPAIEAL